MRKRRAQLLRHRVAIRLVLRINLVPRRWRRCIENSGDVRRLSRFSRISNNVFVNPKIADVLKPRDVKMGLRINAKCAR